jgi:hypothetical protein
MGGKPKRTILCLECNQLTRASAIIARGSDSASVALSVRLKWLDMGQAIHVAVQDRKSEALVGYELKGSDTVHMRISV